MAAPVVVILAAGHGTRMRSELPKVLHPICGRPMVLWPVRAALEAGAARVVVVGGPDRALEPLVGEGVTLAVQAEALGTGDAVRAAAADLDPGAPTIVLAGDVPLVTPGLVAGLAEAHSASGAAATIVTMDLDDPAGYGRVVRGAGREVERVVETKTPGDATEAELAIREVNTGIFAFDTPALLAALDEVRPHNVQGEYYLPDVLPALREAGGTIAAHVVDDPALTLGVNDRVGLAAVRAVAQRLILERHMRAGVTVVDPRSTVVDVDVEIGPDTVVAPFTSLLGSTRVGSGCAIGPLTTATDCDLGDGVTVPHSYLAEARAEAGATIGPFAYLRPGTLLREGSKAGTFVEIKNSDVGAGTKVPHLSYIGDADVGEGTNLGAGTITANYDGRRKHRTRIGSGVKGGVDVSLVAPVELGDRAWTAAGSVITEDVPEGALGVARERQRNVEGYAERGGPGDAKP